MAKQKSTPALLTDNAIFSLAEHCRKIMPHLNEKKKPIGCHENIKILLDLLGVTLRYNVMSKEVETIIPDMEFSTDNKYNASLAFIMSRMKQVEMSTAHASDFLGLLADAHTYNPVEDWITAHKWKGESRLDEFLNTITPAYSEDKPAIEAFITKWMLGAVETICNPNGADSPGILVLQGPQDMGKTWWTRKLCPDEAVKGAVRVGVGIDPHNKDSIEQCVAHWIVEAGELDGIFRRADIAALKNFLTRSQDTFRKSFAARKSEYPRRTSFIASVNEHNYLVDDTGNRRFWTVACKAVASYHEVNMQQLWAEIYYKRFTENMPYILNKEEKILLTNINDRHQTVDPIFEKLIAKYDWQSDKTKWRWLSATEIVEEIGYLKPDSLAVRRCGSAVRKLSQTQPRRTNGRDLLHIPYSIQYLIDNSMQRNDYQG